MIYASIFYISVIFHQEIKLLWHRKERVISPPFLPYEREQNKYEFGRILARGLRCETSRYFRPKSRLNANNFLAFY